MNKSSTNEQIHLCGEVNEAASMVRRMEHARSVFLRARSTKMGAALMERVISRHFTRRSRGLIAGSGEGARPSA
jgi:hypothetical protein